MSAAATLVRSTPAAGVHVVDCSFEGVPLEVQLIGGADGWGLIDAGVAGMPTARIFRALAELGGSPDGVALLVNTHVHHDHRGGNAEVRAASPGVRVAVPEPEIGWAESAERYVLQTQDAAFPGAFDPPAAAQERMRRLCGADVVVDVGLLDGDGLDLPDGRRLRVIAAPAHSPGHVVLHDPDAGVAFTGDVLQGEGVRVERGGWLFPLYASVEAYAASLATVERLDAEVVCTSHYGVLDRDGVRGLAATGRSFMARVDAELVALLSGGVAVDLRSAVRATLAAIPGYRDTVGVYMTVAAHLDHLVRRGSVAASIADGVKQWQWR
jgi:glyoxylase-like metal-dependent hydrolase (beta-lactamase superfamily II)